MCVDSFIALLNIDGVHNFLASLLGDLASVFLGVFVTLHLFLVMTLMLMARFSCTFVISSVPIVTTVVMPNNLRVMSHNVGVVVDLFMFFLTMSDYNIFTFFNFSNIHNNIILHMALLVFLLFGFLVALMILLVMTMRTTVVSQIARFSFSLYRSEGSIHKRCRQKEN